MKNKIWLSPPHMEGVEIEYIKSAFETNWIAPYGNNIDVFENKIKDYLHEDIHVSVLNSGTAAIHLGLILLGVKQNDEVICQSMTFTASANPIIYLNATPIFVDSENDTWNMCPNLLEKAIKDRILKGKKPKVIIAVHLYGMPYKIDEITKVANKYDIAILEDSAEALGSEYKGEKCGTFGDVSIFSFNGNKIITTSAGGAIVSKNKKFIEKANFLASQAKEIAPHFEHKEIGFNYKLSNILAGIGVGQMQVLDQRVNSRVRNYKIYKKELKKYHEISFLNAPKETFSNRWLTCILIKNNNLREKIRLNLQEKNIESRPLWKPLHLQPVFEKSPSYLNGVSENLFKKGLCLPSGSNLKNEELVKIINVIKESLEND